MKTVKVMKLSSELGDEMNWEEWCGKIPDLDPYRTWTLTALPPFRGAMIRYEIRDRFTGTTISVYLDCYNILGIWRTDDGEPQPYWEIYSVGEDHATRRFKIGDVDEMCQRIEEEFDDRRNLKQRVAAKVLRFFS